MTVARFTSDDDNNRLAEVAALREPWRKLTAGVRIARITARGVKATVAYRLDVGEHARRCAYGLLAVTDLEKLDVLLGLPAELPVRTSALNGYDRRIIERLPHGCVQASNGEVTRRIVRPVRVELAVVTPDSEDWRAGLRKARQFSSYCTHVLAIADTPDELPDVQAEATYCGTGLVINAANIPLMVVPPEYFIPTAHTAAGWRFAEQVYHEIVRCDLV